MILTHGAGGDMNLPQLILLAHHLAKHGFLVLRYTCKGLNLQYRINVYKEIVTFMKTSGKFPKLKGCFLGGRSMGARAAVGTSIELQGTSLDGFVTGVICISYPLHTPKDRNNLRDGPVMELRKPCLFISGSSDEMCDQDLLLKTLEKMRNCDVEWITSANHSLKVKGEPDSQTATQVGNKILEWSKHVLVNLGKEKLEGTASAKQI